MSIWPKKQKQVGRLGEEPWSFTFPGPIPQEQEEVTFPIPQPGEHEDGVTINVVFSTKVIEGEGDVTVTTDLSLPVLRRAFSEAGWAVGDSPEAAALLLNSVFNTVKVTTTGEHD